MMTTFKFKKQGGMSIIESMVGTALIGTLLASVMVLQSRAGNETSGRSNADSLASFQQLAGQYFISNRTAIESAMGGDAASITLHCQINVASGSSVGTNANNTTKRTCAFDTTLLRAKGLWPAGISTDVAGPGRWVAIARQVMSSGTATGASEMLIVMAPLVAGNVSSGSAVSFTGDTRRASEEISAGMAALGANGGFIPPGSDYGNCQYNVTTKQVCGTGWVVTLSDFIN